MERTVLPTLTRVPKDFTAMLTNVLEGPFDDLGAIDRAKWCKQMANEVLAMADGS